MIQNDIIRLIVVEESANDAEVILNSLRKARFPIRPRHIEDEEDLQEALNEQEWDLIISVPCVVDFTIRQVCDMVKSSKLDIPIIGISHKLSPEQITEALSAGACHLIPSENDVVLQVVVRQELNNLNERRQRRHLEQLYKESQEHNKMLLQSSRDAIGYVHDGMHIYANPSYLEMFGYEDMDDLAGMPVMDLVSLEDQAKFKEFMREYMTNKNEEEKQIELEGLRSNNKRFKLAMEVSQAIYDSERCIQIIIREQAQNKELEQEIKKLKIIDPLTGLFNRQHFITLLEKSIGKAMETHMRSVLLFIALDNFVNIRENIGMAASDPIVVNIAMVLKEVADKNPLARFSDSAFTLLLPEKDLKYGEEIAQQILQVVESSVTEVGEQSVVVTCSIGLALVLASATSPDSIINDAAQACQIVRKRGGNSYEIYKAVLKADAGVNDSSIVKLIETAIEENRLHLRYQPIVSLHGDTNAIYEVFLRMVDSEGNVVPTGALFSSAEKANMTIDLDKWVLKEAVKNLLKQKTQGTDTYFFIKLTDQAIKDETVLLFIRKLLKSTQVPGEQLIFEISETIAISQIKLAQAFIKGLNSMGCKTALEHYGTGLNSATTLKHLPVDYVKIDSSFSKGLPSTPENQKEIKKIVQLAHEQDKQTIAEAVEDVNSLTILWQCEVDFAQGHCIQEPMDELLYDFDEEEEDDE